MNPQPFVLGIVENNGNLRVTSHETMAMLMGEAYHYVWTQQKGAGSDLLNALASAKDAADPSHFLRTMNRCKGTHFQGWTICHDQYGSGELMIDNYIKASEQTNDMRRVVALACALGYLSALYPDKDYRTYQPRVHGDRWEICYPSHRGYTMAVTVTFEPGSAKIQSVTHHPTAAPSASVSPVVNASSSSDRSTTGPIPASNTTS
jgi:hypothetical protein